ncbi:hypothetical protein EYF80_053414 [Liparis tanakae]|uniref:Uncharacterized protein n=1 Tax=Liparis tanakae TaxID=230148 RepID=A0A4Z2F6F8_9TELE|nr:hypothetical protein EYF80_053414 [Liparis tanakae]
MTSHGGGERGGVYSTARRSSCSPSSHRLRCTQLSTLEYSFPLLGRVRLSSSVTSNWAKSNDVGPRVFHLWCVRCVLCRTLRRGSLRKSSCSDTSSRLSWMKASTLARTRASPTELAKLRKEMALSESVFDSSLKRTQNTHERRCCDEVIRGHRGHRGHSLGRVGVVQQDLHGLRVQVLEGDVRDAVGLDVAVEDLKQVRTAAGQHGAVGHQLVATHLDRGTGSVSGACERGARGERTCSLTSQNWPLFLRAFILATVESRKLSSSKIRRDDRRKRRGRRERKQPEDEEDEETASPEEVEREDEPAEGEEEGEQPHGQTIRLEATNQVLWIPLAIEW